MVMDQLETSTLPRFLERYLLLATVSDWYKADGQLDKSHWQQEANGRRNPSPRNRPSREAGRNEQNIGQYISELLVSELTF